LALDNVSDPSGAVGAAQIDWLAADLRRLPRAAPIVVLAHRPLFGLYPSWDWATADGDKVIDVLMPHRQVTVFCGHIHQEHHHQTEHIAHHAARSLIFPLPPPGSVPKTAPVALGRRRAVQGGWGIGWSSSTSRGAPGSRSGGWDRMGVPLVEEGSQTRWV
jgi:hypothetical protein